MTTDTKPKLAYEECKIGNKLVKISGLAKGSGMIAPNMATMLSFIFTDANIPSVFLKSILKKVMSTTFNSITVDSDTSTNDMVGIFATGKAKNSKIYNVLDWLVHRAGNGDMWLLKIDQAYQQKCFCPVSCYWSG